MDQEDCTTIETNDGGRIGGISLCDLVRLDFRSTENPVESGIEKFLNVKFKDHILSEVKNVWKVINRRKVIC